MNEAVEIPEISPDIQTKEQNPLTERAISNIDTILSEKGIEYYVVGSVARYAYMDKDVGQKNEVDVIVMDQNRFDEAREIFNDIEKRNQGIEIDDALNGIMIKDDKGKHVLQHGHIKYEIPENLMNVQRIQAGDTTFSTLPPETLLHTYLLGVNKFRNKDWGNAIEFARWVKDNKTYKHADLKVFHKFSRDQWNLSPLRKLQYKWRRFVSNLPTPLRRTILNGIYDLDTVQKARQAFNNLEIATCGYPSDFNDENGI